MVALWGLYFLISEKHFFDDHPSLGLHTCIGRKQKGAVTGAQLSLMHLPSGPVPALADTIPLPPLFSPGTLFHPRNSQSAILSAPSTSSTFPLSLDQGPPRRGWFHFHKVQARGHKNRLGDETGRVGSISCACFYFLNR